MPDLAPPLPRYGEASLADLVPSLLSALDTPGFANRLGLDPADRVCLLMIDGLGWELLQANHEHALFLNTAVDEARTLTAGFPATTVASLGSIGTGLPPGEHGLVGTTMAVPGQPRALNCLHWTAAGTGRQVDLRDRVVPEQLQPNQTAFERAVADGVKVVLVGPRDHARSGLTRAVLRGGHYQSAISLGDLGDLAVRELAAGRRRLVYVYHSDLDLIGHARGISGEAWGLQLRHIDLLVELVAGRLPRGSLLVVTGDHGMVELPPRQRVDLADHPELAAGVRLLAGEARARHVHAVDGAVADLLVAWRAILGDVMWVASREEAIAAGWFGPQVPDRVRPRIGDVVAAARDAVGVFDRKTYPGEAAMVGHHGSMTPAEQLVPLLLLRR
ncbi:MAG TPA: nucleotide pyrophosphatase/phosphodiesterase family protein [Actinomycetes bacterium]|nr:nucleotide pyrophosphatase/phosphodiesterase family protein [Actinomycetes bacterium]